jgi:hypothetical protein
MSSDPFCGGQHDLIADLKLYGRNAFIVEVIHAYMEHPPAAAALKKILDDAPSNAYNRKNIGALGSIKSDEWKAAKSEAWSGEKNPFYGKKHPPEVIESLSEFRSAVKWVTDGFSERQVMKGDPIPDGWRLGRRPNLKLGPKPGSTTKSD